MEKFTQTATMSNTPDGHRLAIFHQLLIMTKKGWVNVDCQPILNDEALTVLERARSVNPTNEYCLNRISEGRAAATMNRRII